MVCVLSTQQLSHSAGKNFAKGCYAISVAGTLPVEIQDLLEEKNIRYVSRDRSTELLDIPNK